MTKAVQFVLSSAKWKAGNYTIAYQDCDDSTAQAGKWDSAKCSANGNAYARNKDLIGVIGTFNSGCAEIIVPILNRAPGGPVGMVSPANTYTGLTTTGPGTAPGEPGKYYPTGKRNYARVVAQDQYQGAADAMLAKRLGVKSVYILNDKEAYGLGVASNMRNSLKKLGIKVTGFAAFDPKASDYTALATKIKGTGAGALFIGGLICENGAQLIKDKVAVLGPNDGSVKLITPDGFTTQQTIDDAGSASAGMYMSVAGQPIDKFQGAAREFATNFSKEYLNGKTIDPYAIYGGQAATVMLNAIGESDGSRSDVISKMFAQKVQNGLLGSFNFSADGDPEGASGAVVAITIYKATDKLVTDAVISPSQATVNAALGK
jgi:branched-chain amino acid transport system substrate-binding protein